MRPWSLAVHWALSGQALHGAAFGNVLRDPLADEAQVAPRLHVTGEVVSWHEFFKRDGDRLGKAAGLRGAEHQADQGHDLNQNTRRVS